MLKSPYLFVVVILVISAFFLLPLTHGPLIMDDHSSLSVLEAVNERGAIEQVKAAIPGGFVQRIMHRPLAILSFVPHNGSEGFNVKQAKVANLLVHLFNGFLLFHLIILLCRSGGLKFALGPALFSVWVFVLHPINSSVIYLTVQRMTSLSTSFMLLSLIAGVMAFGSRRISWPYAGLALVVLPAIGFLFKQNAVLSYGYLGLAILLFMAPDRALRRLAMVLIVLPSALVLLEFAVKSGFSAGYASRPFTLEQRLLTEPRVIWGYLWAIIFPWAQSFSAYQDDVMKSTSFFTPWTTMPAIAALAAMVFAAVRLRVRLPSLAFAIGAFLLGHVIESTVIPLELAFEHRNYSPSAMAALALGFGLTRANKAAARFASRLMPIQLALCIAIAITAYSNGIQWSSAGEITKALARTKADSARAQIHLAVDSYRSGDLDGAIKHSGSAARLAPHSLGAFAQYAALKWSATGADLADVAHIRNSNLWRCYDPLAVAFLRQTTSADDRTFQLLFPLIKEVLNIRRDRLACNDKGREEEYMRASIEGRLGNVETYLRRMGKLIATTTSQDQREYFCGQLYSIGLRRLPQECEPHLLSIIGRDGADREQPSR